MSRHFWSGTGWTMVAAVFFAREFAFFAALVALAALLSVLAFLTRNEPLLP